ncbi:Spy/CpxP family protein refolding chaperone [Roseofilum capinflatum]
MMSVKPMSIARVCAVTLTVLVLGGGMAQAQPHGNWDRQGTMIAQRGGPGQRGPNPQGRLMQQLNLSEQQQQQIQAIRERYEPQLSQSREATQQAREQLRNLMTGNANENQIRAQHQQVQQLAQQMGNLHFESMMEIRGVLDESQRQQFGEMMNQRRDRFSNGPGNRRGNRPGGNNRNLDNSQF